MSTTATSMTAPPPTIFIRSPKPLGGKAYGSIPHLPGSRLGPADHHCHPGQDAICTTKPRDRHDRIIVTEKLDGSCCSVANVGGEIVALTRAGYEASTSPYVQHHMFGDWVKANRDRFSVLEPGVRVVGEWIAQAHGTMYEIWDEPFVPFDIVKGTVRYPHDDAREHFEAMGLPGAHVVHDGGPISVDDAMAGLPASWHGGIGPVEGAVWRVERRGAFDFIAKWVRPDKQDGKYLPEMAMCEAPPDMAVENAVLKADLESYMTISSDIAAENVRLWADAERLAFMCACTCPDKTLDEMRAKIDGDMNPPPPPCDAEAE